MWQVISDNYHNAPPFNLLHLTIHMQGTQQREPEVQRVAERNLNVPRG